MGLEYGIIFQETDQLVKDFSLDLGKRELTLKKMEIGNLDLPSAQFNSRKASTPVVYGK